MQIAEFLTLVLPDQGLICLATPIRFPDGKTAYVHKVFDTIAEAAAFAERERARRDVFYAVQSLREARVWNPAKPDRRTGQLGAFEVRTQRNMLLSRELHLDLDVGETGTPATTAAGGLAGTRSPPGRPPKYASQQEALAALLGFVRATGLPWPMVVSSGRGLHVYWLFQEAIPSEEWRGLAAKLHALVQYHGLRADPARTRDCASVLRVAGTLNHKDPANPRPVQVLAKPEVVPLLQLRQKLDAALVRAGLTVAPPGPHSRFSESGMGSPSPAFPAEAEDQLRVEFDGPPVTMKAVLAACGQMQDLARTKGQCSEPEWYHTLNVIRFVEDGRRLAHRWSSGSPEYSAAQTEQKLGQLEAKGILPTSCQKLAELRGEERCQGCPFLGKVKGPLMAARYRDPAPPPVVQPPPGFDTPAQEIPPPPKPFLRRKGGGIVLHARDRDGNESDQCIYEHDLFPVRRLVNVQAATEQQVWRVVLPRQGERDFVLDADALYDRRKFLATLANQGIYPAAGNIPFLQDYMIAYIAELQKLADAEAQANHLGWSEDGQAFILPDKVLFADGTAKPATLSLGAQRASAAVHKKGTLQRQVELLRFYSHPAYRARQFYIAASLAAPLFGMTGHHGAILNASGPAGAGKTATQAAASSPWADPVQYPINGTNAGATSKARTERISTLANLPIPVDEITHMPVRDAVDMAMGVTQPGHRLRLQENGIERAASGAQKATLMLTTANNSLHGLLSLDNAAGTAGSMRVFEIRFEPVTVHKKHEADAMLHELRQNYGHLGEVFIAYVLRHRAEVEARVRSLVREIDEAASIQTSERFWSAVIGAVLAAAEIAQTLGLLDYDPAGLREWALATQIPQMRGVVEAEYSSPLGLLADYLEQVNDHILVTSRAMGDTSGKPAIDKHPRGQLLGHFDRSANVMWLLKKGFKDWCHRSGANFSKAIDDLHAPQPAGPEGKPLRVVVSRQTRKVLGAGTEYAKAQSWCFVLDMRHPEVAGVVETTPAPVTPLRPPLKLVL